MTEASDCNYTKPQRLNYTEDEARFPWLVRLLDAYHTIDQGVSSAINYHQQDGRNLACAKGCSSCCTTHSDIPVYPLELMGMSWYVIEKLEPPLRDQLQQQLQQLNTVKGCPFLIQGACSIHPMRPIACRQFNVLDKPCAEGEDAFHTRKRDVIEPIKRYMDNAFDVMLPFYGIKKKGERRKAIKNGTLHASARVMQECNWENLPKKMKEYDLK